MLQGKQLPFWLISCLKLSIHELAAPVYVQKGLHLLLLQKSKKRSFLGGKVGPFRLDLPNRDGLGHLLSDGTFEGGPPCGKILFGEEVKRQLALINFDAIQTGFGLAHSLSLNFSGDELDGVGKFRELLPGQSLQLTVTLTHIHPSPCYNYFI